MAEILEQLNNLKELGYIQKAHLNVLEVALEDYKTEIRAKAIDEFATRIYNKLGCSEKDIYCIDTMEKILEQMKGGATDERTGSD